MIAHAEYYKMSRESELVLTDFEKETVLFVSEDEWAAARYQLPSDFLSHDHFMRVVRNLDFTSSPGYPYCLEAPSIGDWLGWDGISFDAFALERLWYDTQGYMDGDTDTYYRVFIKREPHKVSKAESGRWRLIICPPLYEQVAWTMVFGTGNDKEIDTCGRTPSLQGMKLTGGDWKGYVDLFNNRGMDLGADKTAWDWTTHIEWIRLDLELRDRLITSEASVKQKWRGLAEKFYKGAFEHPRLVLSSGLVFQQQYPGILKSGCVNTISSNSHMQVFVHIVAAMRNGLAISPVPYAVGDDTLSSSLNTASIEEFARLGVVVKCMTEGLEFVGHHLPARSRGCGGPVPVYRSKHLFRYTEVPEEDLPSYLDSMVRLYAHVPSFQEFWRELARRNSVELPSEAYVKFWYDYPTDVLDAHHERLLKSL